MKLLVDPELQVLTLELASRHWSLAQWTAQEPESFESEHYCGGFDRDEGRFCFSGYAESGNQCWFEFDLEQLGPISRGELTELDADAVDDWLDLEDGAAELPESP